MSKVYKIAFELAGKLESSFSSSFTQAIQDMQRLEERARQIGAIRISGRQFDEIRDSSRESSEELRELQRRLREMDRTRGPTIDPLPDDLNEAGNQVNILGGKFSKMAVAVTASMAAVGGAIIGAFSALSASDEYVKAMNKIQMATGSSVEEMGEMKEVAKNLYNQNLGENWADLATAMQTVRNTTQLSGDALEEATRNAILMRDVFEYDVAQSIKTADTMYKNFGTTSEEAYGLLAQGAQNGLDKSDELLDSANEYSPYFKSLGFTAEQMFDTFAAGVGAGAFNLDKVGDAVKEFNIRVKDESKGTIEAFQALGMDADKMAQTFARGGPEAQVAFRQVVQAISAIEDPVKRNTVGVQLMGTQFEDLEAGVIAAMGTAESKFDQTKKTMDEMGKIKYNSLGEFFKGIGRELETSLITPMAGGLLPILQDVKWWIDDMAPIWKENFIAVGSEIMGFFHSLNFAEVFAPIMQIIDDVGPKYLGFMQSIWNAAKATFPIFAALAGNIGAAVKTIIKYVSPVVSYIAGKLYPILQGGFQFLADEVFPVLSAVIERFSPRVQATMDKLGVAFSAVWGVVKPVLDGFFAGFEYVFAVIKDVVMSTINSISGVIDGLLTTFGGIIDFVTGVFTGDWEGAWQGVKTIFTGIFDTLGAALTIPLNNAIALINRAIQSINTIKIDVPDWVPGMGGETFGFSIPELPKIGGYADGGIVNSPELAWVGEGGDSEVIVPINNSQRSLDLWTTAGRMLGVGGAPGGSSTVGDFNYSPIYNFYGNADQAAVKQMETATRRDFEQEFNVWKRQNERVSFA
ncbi:phage tail tape measure protein [Brevibacillus reuszeri]|uniref:phage tail tape measure protein n=1 Tax=Brevibacillus reuszeri TaxID=54915 RepID=UPI00289AC029|nr:phage tail tape measure protein [Brevibacillus reuszeri]